MSSGGQPRAPRERSSSRCSSVRLTGKPCFVGVVVLVIGGEYLHDGGELALLGGDAFFADFAQVRTVATLYFMAGAPYRLPQVIPAPA